VPVNGPRGCLERRAASATRFDAEGTHGSPWDLPAAECLAQAQASVIDGQRSWPEGIRAEEQCEHHPDDADDERACPGIGAREPMDDERHAQRQECYATHADEDGRRYGRPVLAWWHVTSTTRGPPSVPAGDLPVDGEAIGPDGSLPENTGCGHLLRE
jgi:hypothetical protein